MMNRRRELAIPQVDEHSDRAGHGIAHDDVGKLIAVEPVQSDERQLGWMICGCECDGGIEASIPVGQKHRHVAAAGIRDNEVL